ncbi:DUF3500 domain-containing protein [Chondrinema litorale]|uniref:DUF3500 domain-containing protein n=1 Tax=Chondrinema litorale TaxID=2994555 RepID=UPI002542A1E3|nr:DUF3500 domain-containing protein [Chondrinema litorale]UZR98530.1 DUF3500 domain-containing protein [Chondrinema litorale]
MTNSIKIIVITLITFTIVSCDKDDDISCTQITWYEDTDDDGLGNPDVSTTACQQPDGYVDNADDDDDSTSITASCDDKSGVEQLVCLAETYLDLLSSSQLSEAQLTYSVSTAQEWSNLPVGNVPRPGLGFTDMSSTQLAAAKALLIAASGTTENEGWDEIEQTLNADDYLKDNGGGNGYGSGLYYLAILGTPSTTDTWEIMFGGHHFAFANTYSGGVLAGGTPSFRGIEPMGTFTYDGTTNQPLNQEQAALAAMLQSLSSTELASAELSGTWNDLLVGPQEDDNFPSSNSGIQVGNLSTAQKELVMTAIQTYVFDIADDDASDILSTYEAEIEDTYIAYSGTTGVDAIGDYVRIDGPSVWIEYSVQNGIILSDPHPHSVWRDKDGDYGGN